MVEEQASGSPDVVETEDRSTTTAQPIPESDPFPAGLDTLRPEYRASEHARYLTYLEDALKVTGEDAARNIALAGGYGVGKSSVLQQYAQDNPTRVVTLSLSTISPEAAEIRATRSKGPVVPELGNDVDDESVSGQIQKSIVKQLLYSRPPGSTPGSRFRRIEEFRAKRAIAIAAILLIPIAVAAYLADSLRRPEAFVNWNPVGVAAIWIVGATIILVALVLLQRLVHNRFRLERFSAGPATIDLGGTDQTYFDRYLDEIVYFFQRTELDVVVFEDLDRFNDAEIFEQLRELNTILNSAEQIKKRPIRFVYAVRDSLFETAPDATAEPAAAGIGYEVAGEAPSSVRVKFFDLIIPMVPFATHRTSRDLLRRALRAGDPGTNPAMERLIGVAAPFLQDMRLITNVGNEYRIFGDHVLNPKIDGLRIEELAAMVLYKNLYLADYEKVRTGRSNLDAVERRAREFVRSVSTAIDEGIAQLEADLAALTEADERAETLALRLENFVESANNAFEGGGVVQYRVDDVTYSSAERRTPDFWKILADNGNQLTVRLKGTKDHPIEPSELDRILETDLTPGDWGEKDRAPILEKRMALLAEKQTLIAAAFHQLMLSDRAFEWSENGDASQTTTFGKYVKHILKPGLGLELLRAGFINWNYSLYVSRYIGETTSAEALNFAIKYVQSGDQNFFFPLKGENEIEGLVVEVGDSLFSSRSAFNIDVVNALLHDSRFSTVLDLLGEGDELAVSFFDAYANSEDVADPGELTEALAPRWPGLLVHIAGLPGAPSRAVALIDRALNRPGPRQFDSSDELRAVIHSSYKDMGSFTEPRSGEVSRVALYDDGGVIFGDDVRV